jgi:hypothetical protein
MKSLSESRALDHMRKGARLMLLHSYGNGLEYYVVPGGHVHRKEAEKILQRPDITVFDDGLFPGSPQSWKVGRCASASKPTA